VPFLGYLCKCYSSICTKSVVIAYINSYKQPLYFGIPGVAVFSDSSPSLRHDRSLSPVHHYRSLIKYLPSSQTPSWDRRPTLIVVPKSTFRIWACEWTPQVKHRRPRWHKGRAHTDHRKPAQDSKLYHNYEFASVEKSRLQNIQLSNLLSSMKHIPITNVDSQIVPTLISHVPLLITGTPLQNSWKQLVTAKFHVEIFVRLCSFRRDSGWGWEGEEEERRWSAA